MVQRFFLFANRLQARYGDLDNFLLNHPDYNSNSVFILLNTAEPLKFSSVINFPRKWIFFRVLSNTVFNKNRKLLFRDLTLLKKYQFEYFSSLPDCGEPRDFFLQEINNLNIDTRHLYPDSLSFIDEHHDLVHKLKRDVKPWAKQKTLSSGLWLYIHLKNNFPSASFTFIGFDGNISSQFHNPCVENEYLQDLFKCNSVETYQCIME